MEAAKLARAAQKRLLTKSMNKARRLITTQKRAELSTMIDELTTIYGKLEEKQEDFVTHLTTVDEYDAAEEYMSAIDKEWNEVVEEINVALGVTTQKTASADAASTTDQAETAASLLQALHLPHPTIEPYDGDPKKYTLFMANFKQSVENITTNGHRRLGQLLQATTGRAHRLITDYVVPGGEAGYKQAMATLKEKCGHPRLITEAYLKDLRAITDARSNSGLSDFAINIRSAYHTLKEIGTEREMDNQQFILEMCLKLKQPLRYKWRDRVAEYLKKHDKYPLFDEFISFVDNCDRVTNDVIYGGDVLQERQAKPKSEQKKVSGYSTGVKHSDCPLCSGNHKLFMCKKFKAMNITERISYVDQNKLCHVCLGNNHDVKDCKSPYKCSVDNCGQRHTKMLHNTSVSNANISTDVYNTGMPKCNVLLPIVPVIINGTYRTYALLDTGSTSTFCCKSVIDSLQVNTNRVSYQLNTLQGSCQKKSHSADLTVTSIDGEMSMVMRGVLVHDNFPVHCADMDVANFAHLRDLQSTPPKDACVKMIIGLDNPEAFSVSDRRDGTPSQPFATKTPFGWAFNGPVLSGSTSRDVMSNHISLQQIDKKVKQLWELESHLGQYDSSDCTSIEDKRVLDLWNANCSVEDGHIQLPIPWRNAEQPMPDNLSVARARLHKLKVSLDKTGTFARYDAEMQRLIAEGYIEPIHEEDTDCKHVWYLPHHAVPKSEPGKIRIVFDCAHKYQGVSLNSMVLQGPNLTSKLTDVLLGFRIFEHAFTADIHGMYNQVRIPKKDRDALRLLWVSGDSVVQLRSTCHLFGGIWCSSSASYALRKTAELTDSEIIRQAIYNSFYVDDLCYSAPSAKEANVVAIGLKDILAEGKFILHKYTATSSEILSGLQASSIKNAFVEKQCKDSMPKSKALGVVWDVHKDTLQVPPLKKKPARTKAEILSILACIYDPLGFVSPILVKGKVLFQEAVAAKLKWNQEIPDELKSQWGDWYTDVIQLEDINTPRNLIPGSHVNSAMELHCFCDASEQAYGCVIYLRCSSQTGKIHTALVCSKGRIAPLKSTTIPRLELQAAVLGVKVEAEVRRVLSPRILLCSTCFWSDSQIVLAYITNDSKRFHTYVSNRVSLIRGSTQATQWQHIPGNKNPADLLTRPCTTQQLISSEWFTGPSFLQTHKSKWELQPLQADILQNDKEIKTQQPITGRLCQATQVSNHPLDKLIEHFSDWKRLRRSVAWLIKYRNMMVGRKVSKDLIAEDLLVADTVLLQHAQEKSFIQEFRMLKAGSKVKSGALTKLSPSINERGLIVVGGRMMFSGLPEAQKRPIILPYDSRLSALLVKFHHDECHLGREWLLSKLRKWYWIVKARRLIYKVTKDCMICKKLFGKLMVQRMADLPAERVTPVEQAFTRVGTDVFGPFVVKRGRHEVKRYGCIFVCFNVRAVHIELLEDLSSDTFLNALRRFCARRGVPHLLFSDNATNFIGAKGELEKGQQHLNEKKIKNYCANKGIEWQLNVPYASHMGGFYERLIRTARKVLTGLLIEKQRLTDTILSTFFCEAECIINSRPLTKISSDINDASPLTPSHFLLVKAGPYLPFDKYSQADMYRRRWRYIQHLADVFWRRYVNQYLPELQRRQKWIRKERCAKEGDLVLMMDELTPRHMWPLALVIATNRGRDGLVRSVRVKTASSEYVPPVHKLVLLEVDMV